MNELIEAYKSGRINLEQLVGDASILIAEGARRIRNRSHLPSHENTPKVLEKRNTETRGAVQPRGGDNYSRQPMQISTCAHGRSI
ncbi:hypothetical protein F5Y05DRAFT_383569 [Hypoxylon sp. FL0543]|nr:hypothetical protein F5Y05DRAFT_383569 [Hypoxylon sp. FL0543]